MDYDELRRIYRLEKNSTQLVKLDDDFFSELKSFLREKQSAYKESIKKGNLSMAKNYSELKKLVKEIIQLREKKLLNKALLVSRTGEFSDENLSVEEKKTFNKIISILKEHKAEINSLLGEKEQPKEKTPQSVKVTIFKEVPAFVGADMKEYGPFSAGMEVELPKKTADLLVSTKLAEIK